MSASFLVVGSSFLPFLFPFHLPFFLPGWPGWIIPSAVSPIVVSRVAVLRAAGFRTASGIRYRCSGASPALPMPSGMSCALRTWLLLPGCDPACLPVLWVPGAGCPPLACLLSGGGAACRGFSLVPGGAFSAPASPGIRGNAMSFSPAPQPLRAVIPFSSTRRPCRLPSRSP